MVADEIRRILEKTAPGQAYVTVKRSLLQSVLDQELPHIRIEQLFHQHETLTHLEVLRMTGYTHGRIADIVREPAYVIAEVVKVKQSYANKWRLNK